MATLSARRTRLGRLVRELGGAAAQVAPVAPAAAAALGDGATTFAALDRDPAALAAAIERVPGTLAQGTTSLRASRGFLGDSAELARRLREPASRAHQHAAADRLRAGGGHAGAVALDPAQPRPGGRVRGGARPDPQSRTR